MKNVNHMTACLLAASLILGVSANYASADNLGGVIPAASQSVCGNNTVEVTEECDAGSQNGFAGSGCTVICTIAKEESQSQNPPTHLELNTANIGTQNVEDQRVASTHVKRMDVESLTVHGEDGYPVFRLDPMFRFASIAGDDPWMASFTARLMIQWKWWAIGGDLGVGAWEKYGVGLGAPMLHAGAFIYGGHELGGGLTGVDSYTLAPLSGHGPDERWETLVVWKLGGMFTIPDLKSWGGFVISPWVGVPVYIPRNPHSPDFSPLVMIGVDIGPSFRLNPRK